MQESIVIKSLVTGIHTLAVLLTHCVALGKWVTLSDLLFPHL